MRKAIGIVTYDCLLRRRVTRFIICKRNFISFAIQEPTSDELRFVEQRKTFSITKVYVNKKKKEQIFQYIYNSNLLLSNRLRRGLYYNCLAA